MPNAQRVGRGGIYDDFLEELSEYLVLRSRDANAEPLVAPIHGVVETSMGLGLEVDRISSPNSYLSPTLDDLIRERRVNQQLRESVNVLANRLSELHVVVSDFNARNIVLRPDGKGFCVVDGLGETTSLRFRKISAWAWRKSLEKMRRSIQECITTGKCWSARDKSGPGWKKLSGSVK